MRKRKKKSDLKKLLIAIGILLMIISLGGGTAAIIKTAMRPFLVGAVIGLVIGITVIILNTPKVKGKLGERKVGKTLEKIANKRNGYVINDVIVPDTNSNLTSQVDHVMIDKTGIYVVETKNYAGRIYGSESQEQWTQVLKYGAVKNKLYNPIKQNQTHVFRLSKSLGIKVEKFYSLVVFVGGADISRVDSEYLFSLREMKNSINETIKEQLDDETVKKAYQKLKEYKDNPIQTNKEHVQQIKQTQKTISSGICPKCGGTMVLRKSKEGHEFYGCSNFPKCKFTMKKR